MRKLKRALDEAGIEYADFCRAIQFFKDRKIDFNWVPRGFRFWQWAGDRPQMVILWTSPALTRDYLDAPSTVIAELKRLEQIALSA